MKTKDVGGSTGVGAPRAERSDIERAGASRVDGACTEASHADSLHADSLHADSLRADSLRADASRADSLRERASRVEASPHANAATARGASADWRAVLAGASPREVLARLVSADVFELRARVARALAERCYLLDGDFVYLRCIARIARFATRYRGEPSLDVWLAEQVDAALLDALERADVRGDARAGDVVTSSEAGASEVAGSQHSGSPHSGSPHSGGQPGGGQQGGGQQGGGEHGGRECAQSAAPKLNHAEPRNTPSHVAPTFVDLARPLGLDPDRMRDVCSAFNRCAPLERAAFFAVVLERGDLESVAARLGVAPAECARAARHALECCMERATAGPSGDVGSQASSGAAAHVRHSAAPAGERAEQRARLGAVPNSGRNALEADTAGASVLHARGAERRSNPRGERGDAR